MNESLANNFAQKNHHNNLVIQQKSHNPSLTNKSFSKQFETTSFLPQKFHNRLVIQIKLSQQISCKRILHYKMLTTNLRYEIASKDVLLPCSEKCFEGCVDVLLSLRHDQVRRVFASMVYANENLLSGFLFSMQQIDFSRCDVSISSRRKKSRAYCPLAVYQTDSTSGHVLFSFFSPDKWISSIGQRGSC